MLFHIDGTKPKNNEIFVFGSNLAGIHGKRAALYAVKECGAKYGIGVGFQGSSYAIPTKDAVLVPLKLEIINQFIITFILFTKNNLHMDFFMTRIGCGLAGYKDNEIAPMFKGNHLNINFPIEWKDYL